MEQIVVGLIGLLARLSNSWNSVITTVEEFRARLAARVPRIVEGGTAVILWSVPIVFWTAVVRFVIKHW
ncbi:MAG TPA: hypothetical protein VMJ35_10315 [Dongiaceae bacterium]|nr:hypothetical protein [Dongiaceae bacterium]